MPVCPNCGQDNPAGFRFCGNCASPLEARPTGRVEERKVVTVLFCDVVGFTARSDRADPEDVRATLRPYHARVRKEIERFGGTVEKFIGDAVMAVFGAPVAHEDDAERAVRAALRIPEAISEAPQEISVPELAVRIGIDTGEAVVSLDSRPEEGEGIVAGDVVNTAARLQQAAPVGGVVVGEMTYRTTKESIEYEPLGAVRVKGKREPVPIWRARGARGRFGVDVEQVSAAPFVGRDHDLALLKETYAKTLRESSVQLVTVTGEPGVGKTRLISEFRSYVDGQPELVWWRQGRCLPYGEGITFWALGEIVKAQAGILESDSPERAAEKLGGIVSGVIDDPADHEWVRTRLAPLVGARAAETAGTVERGEYFTAWRRFLESLAVTRPLVLVFEDLHWADLPMLDFVDHVVDWATDVPIVVVCSARPELYERQPGWGGGKRNSTTISLAPLTSDETARLISALLSEAVLPVETQAILLERSGGNPLYAEEFVRMLTDRRILEHRGRVLSISPGAEIPVPESVQALIAARLDTLPSERKSLLYDAAVVGKVFWAGALSFMGDLEERMIGEGLHELARKELLRPSRTSSMRDQAEYAFWHLLIRDVAYGQIPRAARATKHVAAARWLQRIAGDRVPDHAELLAHHYSQALEMARAAGTGEVAELEDATRRFLVLAGDRAMQLDVAKAETYYARALELLAPGHPDRAKVLTKEAESLFLSGRFPESEGVYQEAIEELRGQGNALGLGEAMVSLSFVHGFRGQTGQSRALLAEVVELLEREPPGRELVRAYAQTTREHMLLGKATETLQWSEKTLALAEQLGMDDITAMVLQFRGNARCQLGDLGGLDDLRHALNMSLDLGLGNETMRAHINYGDNVWYTEGPARGLEVFRTGIDFGERRGITGPVKWIKGESLWLLFDLGDWDELVRAADELIAWDRTHGGSYFGVMALSYKAWVLIERGETGEAATLKEEFLPRARAIKDPQILAPALVISALIDRAEGKLPSVIPLIEELAETTRGNPTFRAQCLTDALRALIGTGETRPAEELLEGADVTSARHRNAVLTGRAVLAEAKGDFEGALNLHEEAATRWSEYGHPFERGHALLGAGRCLLALGRREEAASRLREARRAFVGLRARPLISESDAWLAQATALSS